ncbi:hypothetical protein L4174_014920 [Photobacterium sp. CCB-ST2H9]|uniref:hypothetical protein n=1 Tax=Photobacterium sp. CCB-ST2H9 TaxID=2912855 RepID=UPI0020047108|nr:hypothetical protein [Photobacterium sp. CCB-ST2H9]UTM57070.1 hypothetical protein L4174_014920 [Photobacterium sp. CCB-ST2H9]
MNMKWSASYCLNAMVPVFLISLLIPFDDLVMLLDPQALCYVVAVSVAGYAASQGKSFQEKLACAEKMAWVSGFFAALIGLVRTFTSYDIVTGAMTDASAILVGIAVSVLPLIYAAGIAMCLTPLKHTAQSEFGRHR